MHTVILPTFILVSVTVTELKRGLLMQEKTEYVHQSFNSTDF